MITSKTFKKINNDRELKKLHVLVTKYFNKFIRLRDLERNEITGEVFGHCIACKKKWEVNFYSDGSIMNPDNWCAMHYFLSDRNESVRYHENNVCLGCFRCNKYLSGNLALYKINLMSKIGLERFEHLIFLKNQIKKYNYLELEELKNMYKEKCKLEAKRLGIKL